MLTFCYNFFRVIIKHLRNIRAFYVIFRREENGASSHVSLGPVVISVEMIKIGIVSSLIVFLPTYLIVILFKFAAPMKNKDDNLYEQVHTQGECECVCVCLCVCVLV